LSQGILSEDGIALIPAFLSRHAAMAAGGGQRPAAVLTFYTGKRWDDWHRALLSLFCRAAKE